MLLTSAFEIRVITHYENVFIKQGYLSSDSVTEVYSNNYAIEFYSFSLLCVRISKCCLKSLNVFLYSRRLSQNMKYQRRLML